MLSLLASEINILPSTCSYTPLNEIANNLNAGQTASSADQLAADKEQLDRWLNYLLWSFPRNNSLTMVTVFLLLTV